MISQYRRDVRSRAIKLVREQFSGQPENRKELNSAAIARTINDEFCLNLAGEQVRQFYYAQKK